MKRFLMIAAVMMWSAAVYAAGTTYVMRVDGLACPYCAYGVEQKLKKIEGVKPDSIDVDLDKGLVSVSVEPGVALTEPQMRALFQDAGFTYRSMRRVEVLSEDTGAQG